MSATRTRPGYRRRVAAAVVSAVAGITLATACGSDSTTAVSGAGAGAAVSSTGTGLFDSSQVHTISIEYDEADYQAMLATFAETGERVWISATVTIDGEVFENVGIKLKGNSTLQGLAATITSTGAAAETTPASDDAARGGPAAGGPAGGGPGGDVSADEPEGLPWRIRLDKFVEGQDYAGRTDVVIRGGSTETSLNEAVALELIGAAGLPTEEASAVRVTVNGSDEALRLVIENPTETWYEETLATDGILYKAESGGDYSYRGEDPEAYTEAFDLEVDTSGQGDYTPLIEFLDFVNTSDDATFAAGLPDRLDVDAFATYLAIQDLVANADDIDGPGNNSYLHYDTATGEFTVVAWDQNLSFGGMGGGSVGGGPVGARPGAPMADDGARPGQGMAPPGSTAPQGGPSRGNVLAERFLADDDFHGLYDAALEDLRTALYASGEAQEILDTWVAVLTDQASDLVPAETIESEASVIAEYFTAVR